MLAPDSNDEPPAAAAARLPCVVIGGGPAGLAAAETIAAGGVPVVLADAMRSLGRKFLLAGKGGLNLTHAEPLEPFVARYAGRAAVLAPLVHAHPPAALREWAAGLGIDTFVGSSRRVFPVGMKAAPLLRAWLHRLRAAGVRISVRHRWLGWAEDGRTLRFATPSGEQRIAARAVVLALGGASWARLGSDGAWVPLLAARGIDVAPLVPANCGFDVGWSSHLATRFAGSPLKRVAITVTDEDGRSERRLGECVITATGIEGSLVYGFAARLRAAIAREGRAALALDLLPDRPLEALAREIAVPRGSRSLSSHLRSRTGLEGVKAALLREVLGVALPADPQRLAEAVKALPLTLVRPRPIDEAISSAGGVRFAGLDDALMLRGLPGVFCAGEMLDWEAPTGGYLLTACFATGRRAGEGVLAYLRENRSIAEPMQPGDGP